MQKQLTVTLTTEQWAKVLTCLDIIETRERELGEDTTELLAIMDAIYTDEYDDAILCR